MRRSLLGDDLKHQVPGHRSTKKIFLYSYISRFEHINKVKIGQAIDKYFIMWPQSDINGNTQLSLLTAGQRCEGLDLVSRASPQIVFTSQPTSLSVPIKIQTLVWNFPHFFFPF